MRKRYQPAHNLGSPFYKLLHVIINLPYSVSQQDVIPILIHSVTTVSRNYRQKNTNMIYYQSMCYSNWLLTHDLSGCPFQTLYSSFVVVPSIMDALVATSLLSQTLPSRLIMSRFFLRHGFLFRATEIFIFLSLILIELCLYFPKENMPPTLTCGSPRAIPVWNLHCDNLTLKILEYFYYLCGLLP